MASVGDVFMGRINHCRWCRFCDDLGNCSKIGRNIGWDMAYDIEITDKKCPKRSNKNERYL